MNALQILLQQTVNGVQIGSVYALIAVGYTMVYGVLKFINFAHGDVYMVGAYTGFFTVTAIFASKAPAIQGVSALVLAMVACSMLGLFIERLAYRPLRNGIQPSDAPAWSLFWSLYITLFLGGWLVNRSVLPPLLVYCVTFAGSSVVMYLLMRRLFASLSKKLRPSSDRLTALITAIGVSLLLENQGAASFGVTPRAAQIKGVNGGKDITLPTLFSQHIKLSVGVGQIVVLVAALLLTAVLVYTVRFTSVGRSIRAVSLDRDAAALMGIPTDTVIAVTFLIGSALAGAAGMLNHMLTGIPFDSNIGIALGLKAFVAAVLGGIGSIEGAVLGALLMGVAETFTSGSAFSPFKDAVAFVILIVVLLFKPSGLMGRYAPEKV